MIKSIIEKVIKDFFEYEWKSEDFLTEDDIRGRLFMKLCNSLEYQKNVGVHSEIRWYGKKPKKLKYRSDIVIIDNDDLRTKPEKMFKLPHKGYAFGKYYAVIEIKLRRITDTSADNTYEKKFVQSDIDKLKEIKEKIKNHDFENANYFVICFDKKRKQKTLIDINKEYEVLKWIAWD